LLGITGTVLALTRRSEAAPPEPYIPTTADILSSDSVTKLNAYYTLIGELYITGQISYDGYMLLYNAYVDRFYELTEGV